MKILKDLRHPIWAVIGTVATLISLVITIVIIFIPEEVPKIVIEDDKKLTKTFLFILNNYNEEVIDEFVENVLVEDRKVLRTLLSKLAKASSNTEDKEMREMMEFMINLGEEYDAPYNFTNDILARFIKIISKNIRDMRKFEESQVNQMNKILKKTLDEGKTNIKGFTKLQAPENRVHIADFYCHGRILRVKKNTLFEYFEVFGLRVSKSQYYISDGWDYVKVAKQVCSSYLVENKSNKALQRTVNRR